MAATQTETVDYVIVGAGSAGCVLAARLSADPAVRVLLLEAGPSDDADEIRIPAAFASLFKTRWDWDYLTTPQKRLLGQRAYWPRMKALGGCSAMNAMIYMRGSAADYDDWRDEFGATGWSYADVLPYFKRAEDNTRGPSAYHGVGGPLHVEDRRYTHELTQAWVEAAVAAGVAHNDDFNGAAQEGAGLFQVTQKGGRRWSVADGYLRPALDRPNLTARTNALATRVELESGRAIGLAYRHRGADHMARAEREVLLAGGAVNSPALLMLSGIGPAAHLREVGIDVAVDLPGVGENLHDHPATPLVWLTRGTTDLTQLSTPSRLVQWQLFGRGPLVSNVGEGGAFLRSSEGLDEPDIQVHVAPVAFFDNGLREVPGAAFTAGPTLVRVASRGRLRLRSADPRWKPEIDPAYFSAAEDFEAMVSGCELTRDIVGHQPLARFIDRPFLPAGGTVDRDGLREHVRRGSQTLYHPVGSCAMGSHEQAVVDSELRVRGVEDLRVVDASVMPRVPRGNTNAPTVMIAERAADLIAGRPVLPPSAPPAQHRDDLAAGGVRPR